MVMCELRSEPRLAVAHAQTVVGLLMRQTVRIGERARMLLDFDL
jgi:hypothetical protein